MTPDLIQQARILITARGMQIEQLYVRAFPEGSLTFRGKLGKKTLRFVGQQEAGQLRSIEPISTSERKRIGRRVSKEIKKSRQNRSNTHVAG